jgi:FkbM family methyltransferase
MIVERHPPLWYRIAIKLPHGGIRFLKLLDRNNKLNDAYEFKFHDRTLVHPLSYLCPFDVTTAMINTVRTFARFCDSLGRFDFVDCGASMGVFSAQFTTHSEGVEKLTAIEPNPKVFPLLEWNLTKDMRARKVECINAAVSDFEGRASLVEPVNRPGNVTAMYIVEDPQGDIPVIKLSTVLQGRAAANVAIKLDVEGAELPILRGAADALRSIDCLALCIEIHREVLDRIGTTDTEMLAEIDDIRPFNWFNSIDGKCVDVRHSIFDQVNNAHHCDLIAMTRAV